MALPALSMLFTAQDAPIIVERQQKHTAKTEDKDQHPFANILNTPTKKDTEEPNLQKTITETAEQDSPAPKNPIVDKKDTESTQDGIGSTILNIEAEKKSEDSTSVVIATAQMTPLPFMPIAVLVPVTATLETPIPTSIPQPDAPSIPVPTIAVAPPAPIHTLLLPATPIPTTTVGADTFPINTVQHIFNNNSPVPFIAENSVIGAHTKGNDTAPSIQQSSTIPLQIEENVFIKQEYQDKNISTLNSLMHPESMPKDGNTILTPTFTRDTATSTIAAPSPIITTPEKTSAQATTLVTIPVATPTSSVPSQPELTLTQTPTIPITALPELKNATPEKIAAQTTIPVATPTSSVPNQPEPVPGKTLSLTSEQPSIVKTIETPTPEKNTTSQDTLSQTTISDDLSLYKTPANSNLSQQQAVIPQPITTPLPQPLAAHAAIYRPAHEQIAIAVRQASNDGVEQISVRLKPEHLGTIDVKMSIASDGTVQAVLSADKPETVHWLRQDAAQLERSLQEAGLKTESGSMQFQLRQDTGQNSSGQGRPEPATMSARPIIRATTDTETPQPTWVRPGGINIRV
ncbi:MAG: flagellar hook-length control protein FliK [Holosporales bacterium]